MDLKEFYFSNITEEEYYFKFYDSIKSIDQSYNILNGLQEKDKHLFEVFDAEEAITAFRELCQPEVYFNNEKKCWFYLVTYYLYKMGYTIKEFPRLLARPPLDPSDFTYKQIRNKIINEGKDDNGTVRYAMRRVYVAKLTFELESPHIDLTDAIEQRFSNISNRHSSFANMSKDEKLAEIANIIENLLKIDGRFISLEYSKVCLDFITNDSIKRFRKIIQCFRHSTEEAISERNTFSEEQKNFLVDYGLTVVKVIHTLLN